MKFNRLFAILFATCFMAAAHGQQSWIDKEQVRVGEHFIIGCKLPYPLPADASFAQPIGNDTIQLLGQDFDTLEATANNAACVRQLTSCICFAPGHHAIAVVAGGSPDTSYLHITVDTLPAVDTASVADVRDIDPIIKEPYTFWEIARWPVLAIVLAALVVALVYIIGRIKSHKPIIPALAPKPIPPYDMATRQLDDLRQKALWQKGLVKQYYTDLTDIVRQYIEGEFGVASTDMTTAQTIEALSSIAYRPKGIDDQVRQLLDTADMVKFARSEPSDDVHGRAMAMATTIVDEMHSAKEEEEKAQAEKLKTASPEK
ncbi:MAG: hypothetical protein IJU81_09275 [Bacteroidales bacterium]|nr:hypothetical protein [Bacteroidales bacterium]